MKKGDYTGCKGFTVVRAEYFTSSRGASLLPQSDILRENMETEEERLRGQKRGWRRTLGRRKEDAGKRSCIAWTISIRAVSQSEKGNRTQKRSMKICEEAIAKQTMRSTKPVHTQSHSVRFPALDGSIQRKAIIYIHH
eukprot:939021-Amphidinium_carterae.1